MARTKTQKRSDREVVAKRLSASNAAIVAEYRGISAEDIRQLRLELKKVNSEFRVIKNRVARKALEDVEACRPLDSLLKGPVGVVHLNGDVAQASKVLLNFARDKEKFKITGGVFDGKFLSQGDVKAISELPSKEVLIARILGSIKAPHQGLVTVLNGVSAKLVRAVNAIKETKQN